MSIQTKILSLAFPFLLAAAAMAGITPKVTYHFEPSGFKGDSTRMVMHVSLPAGWHIQSNAPLDSFLIATTVVAEGKDLTFGKAVFPKSLEKDYPALGGKVALFEGEFDIGVLVKRSGPKIRSEALKSVKVKLGYQACNDTQCLPPNEIDAVFEPQKKSK